jgi:sugar lactone lactonase YvrE
MKKSGAGAWACAVLVAAGVGAWAETDNRQELRREYEAALSAHERKDNAAFLAHSRRVAELAPHSARALYNLACAHALTGGKEEAVRALDRLATMGAIMDAAGDPDFAAIKDAPEFKAVLGKMAALRTPVGNSAVAFTLPEKDLITEGVAHDPKTGAFFVSSVHRRKIVRVAHDGTVSDFVAQGADGLFAAVALAVDPARNVLWVSTAAEPAMAGYRTEDGERSFVFEYDLASGKPLRKIGLPPAARDGLLSDLTVRPGGALYVSDPKSGRLYVLDPGQSDLRVLVGPGPLASPQGLAFDPAGRWLFAADYVQGIFRVDPEKGSVALLDAPADSLLTGVDGLVYDEGSLVGIQNGVEPHRVLRARLSADAARITEVATLERANPHFDEPTLGVVVGRELFYVANSQYAAVRPDGSLDDGKLREPVILKMSLAP